MYVSAQAGIAKPLPKELKDEIITKIKVEGISGVEAARRYGVNVKTFTAS